MNWESHASVLPSSKICMEVVAVDLQDSLGPTPISRSVIMAQQKIDSLGWTVDLKSSTYLMNETAMSHNPGNDSFDKHSEGYFFQYNVSSLSPPPPDFGDAASGVDLFITLGSHPYVAADNTELELLRSKGANDLIEQLGPWLQLENTFVTATPRDFSDVSFSKAMNNLECREPECSDSETCTLFNACFFSAFFDSYEVEDRELYAYEIDEKLDDCIYESKLAGGFRCGITVMPKKLISQEFQSHEECSGTCLDITSENWDHFQTDHTIGTFREGGGIDEAGIYWLGQSTEGAFSQTLGSQLTSLSEYECSLERPCNYGFSINDIGSRSSWNAGGPDQIKNDTSVYFRSSWGYLALTAL